MGRFYSADESVRKIVDELIYEDERFPNLRAAKIKLIMDERPKIDKLNKQLTFAYIKTTNEVEKYLTKSGETLEGFDYFIFIYDLVWELASVKDKKRILSHELQHTFLDDNGNYKLIKHDIEDFYAEIELNKDDPMWRQALGTVAIAKIDQLKEEAKAKR